MTVCLISQAYLYAGLQAYPLKTQVVSSSIIMHFNSMKTIILALFFAAFVQGAPASNSPEDVQPGTVNNAQTPPPNTVAINEQNSPKTLGESERVEGQSQKVQKVAEAQGLSKIEQEKRDNYQPHKDALALEERNRLRKERAYKKH